MIQINIYNMTSSHKDKFDYDIKINIDTNGTLEEISSTTKKFLTELKEIEQIKNTVAPYSYDVFSKNNSQTKVSINEVYTEINRSLISDFWKKELLLSANNNFYNNETENVIIPVGLTGVSDMEINQLEKYQINGDLNKLKNDDTLFVFLPKYLANYKNNNFELNKLKIGDTIKISYQDMAFSFEEFSRENFKTTAVIAGFVEINPFDVYNGVTNQFSLIMNEKNLKMLVEKPVIKNIYIKGSKGYTTELVNTVSQKLNKYPMFKISNNASEKFIIERQRKENEIQNSIGNIVINTIFLIVLIGIINMYFSQLISRKSEISLLQKIGVSNKKLKIILITETLFISCVGIFIGVISSFLLSVRLNSFEIKTNLLLIPWIKIIVLTTITLFSVIIIVFISFRSFNILKKNKVNRKN